MTQPLDPALEVRESVFRKPLFQMLTLIAFSVLIQLLHWQVDPWPKRDALAYMRIIQLWSESGSYGQVIGQFPKFGLMIFTFLPLKWCVSAGLAVYPASVLYMMVMNAISAVTFYGLIRQLTDDRCMAFFCGLLLAAHPMVLLHATSLMRDTPYLMFGLLAAYMLLTTIDRRSLWRAFAAGLFLMLCMLSRYEGAELLLLLPVLAAFRMQRKEFSAKETGCFALAALAGFLTALLLPLFIVDDPVLLSNKLITVLKSYCHI